MSTNYYLRNHIYKGHEKAHLNIKDKFARDWLGAFDEVPAITPFRQVIDNMHPLIHVCLMGSSRIYWAMNPEHVRALASWYMTQKIFLNEYDDELTGREFLEKVNVYNGDFAYKIGEYFC